MKTKLLCSHSLNAKYNNLFLISGRTSIILLFLFHFFTSCNLIDPGPTEDPINSVNDASSVMLVSPEYGGTLSLPYMAGNGILEIPPGAVDQETEVKISTPQEASPGLIQLGFEPQGLTFNKPIRLTVTYEEEDDGLPPIISMILMSELNDVVDVGHEQHNWTPLGNMELDDQANTISGEFQHFSTILVAFGDQRVAYLILDIPGDYLRPGDGLFVLSGTNAALSKGRWLPGHTGMVRSVDTTNSVLTVFESTVGGGPAGVTNGVQLNPFLQFKRGTHVYMGARRPKGKVMSDGERITAIGFGDLQMGKPYNFLAITHSTHTNHGWACSMLLEACWRAANRGAMGNKEFIPPSSLFEATVPVSEITVKVGEEVRIPVYPVIANNNADYRLDNYDTGVNLSEVVTISSQPDEAEWVVDNLHPYKARTLIWKPEPKDAGESDTITFEVSGSRYFKDKTRHFTVTQNLIIHVRGGHKYLSIYPVPRSDPKLRYAYGLPTPPGAVISPESKDHLIDLATGKFPANPIFENQNLEDYREDWYNQVTFPGKWGPQFSIVNMGTSGITPNGVRSWLYWFHYEVPWYNGL